MYVSPVVSSFKVSQPRFGQLFEVQFTNAPAQLTDAERQQLLEGTANLLVEKLSFSQKWSEAFRSAAAVLAHCKAAFPKYENFFVVHGKAGHPEHFVVMGKHHQKLLQFLEGRMVVRRTDRPTPDMFQQWLVLNQPDQVLKVRLVQSQDPNRWDIKSFKNRPKLPESAVDVLKSRW